jgi:hypothetical protein
VPCERSQARSTLPVPQYKYPSVDPRANPQGMKASLAAIRDAARKTDAPLCIFPEGTRSRDGEIGPFRPTGLKLILKQRPWKVYVLVGDGYWKTAKMTDFIRGMSDVQGKLELAGVFDWPDPSQKSDAFVGGAPPRHGGPAGRDAADDPRAHRRGLGENARRSVPAAARRRRPALPASVLTAS